MGHCLFYDPQYFLSHPLEIILPVHFLPQGGWVFTGYAGLASHGGTLGLILALVLFCRKTKIHFLDILDMMGVAAPVAAGFIRLANLMNSEIIGMPSNVPGRLSSNGWICSPVIRHSSTKHWPTSCSS